MGVVLLALTGGVPGFTSIPLPKSFRSMSICKQTKKRAQSQVKVKKQSRKRKQRYTLTHLAGRRLHHAVVGAHHASVWLGNRGLSIDGGGLGLGGRWGQCQERLAST